MDPSERRQMSLMHALHLYDLHLSGLIRCENDGVTHPREAKTADSIVADAKVFDLFLKTGGE
jgi:hypothetical protein